MSASFDVPNTAIRMPGLSASERTWIGEPAGTSKVVSIVSIGLVNTIPWKRFGS